MTTTKQCSPSRVWTPLRIVAVYTLVGALWILFSDKMAATIVPTPDALSRMQTYKGWFYVAITAVLLYTLIQRMLADRKRLEADLLEAEKQLIQAQQREALGALAGGIAHDFNNILSAIIGYADLAKEGIPSDAPAQADLSEVLSAGFRARDLVQRILDAGRSTVPVQVPLSPAAVVDEALALLRPMLPAGVEILREASSPEMILGDATQLRQVVMHLCRHAVQTLPPGGKLSVTVTNESPALDTSFLPSGHHVCLAVTRADCIRPSGSPRRIFDPYAALASADFGLAIMDGGVKTLGGCVLVSDEPGKGRQLQVFFPIFSPSPGGSPGTHDLQPERPETPRP